MTTNNIQSLSEPDFERAEQAAVFISDEARQPFEVESILEDPAAYRRWYRVAQRVMPKEPSLVERLAEAKVQLDLWHAEDE